jgi:hypothetical protein
LDRVYLEIGVNGGMRQDQALDGEDMGEHLEKLIK